VFWNLKNVCPQPLLIEKQIEAARAVQIKNKSSAMFVKPEQKLNKELLPIVRLSSQNIAPPVELNL